MDADRVKRYFPEVDVIKVYPDSGQKAVFLIEHPKHGKVILKIIRDMNERILREIELATNQQLRNIPKIYEVATFLADTEEHSYFIEQYISGNSLRSEIDNQKFNTERSLALLESLLKTAIELEKANVVHRDIKPDNVICSDNDEFFLIDFGIARMLNKKSLTITNAAVGPHTPGYGAPELFQYSKSNITIKADLFSIGVVVYESMFGKHPFITGNEHDINEVWYRTATAVPLDINIVGDDDRKLMGFLQTLMNKHISRRPPTAQKALDWFYIVKESVQI